MAARRRRSRGTSILEVLTATGIMMTLLAIGLPNLRRLQAPYILSGATHQVEASMQMARQRAIARNARYRIVFDTTAKSYTLQRETTADSWVSDGGAIKLPKGASIGSVSPGNPVFSTTGILPATVSVPITVASSGTRTVTMNVLGKTTIN
jgi:Tfp pilus assembly protein FimT